MSFGLYAPKADRPERRLGYARTHELLLSRMTGVGHPKALSPLAPMFFRPDCYWELFAATRKLVDLASRTLAALGKDHDSRIKALGIDPAYLPAFLPDPELEQAYAGCMVRPDMVFGPSGLRFLELNVGSGFGGVTQTHLLQGLFAEVYGAEPGQHPKVDDPFAARARLLETVAAERSRERSVMILGDPAEYGPDTNERMFELEIAALRARSFRAALILPSQLGAMPRAERYSLGIRNFSMVDWVRSGTDPEPVQTAVAEGCLLLPSQSGTMLADKRLLALISEGLAVRSASDRAFVSAYIPWTRIVRDRSVDWRGRRRDLAELIGGDKDEFVLKRGMGNSGQEVTIGLDTAEPEWRIAVDAALQDCSSVVQEYVSPQPHPLELMNENGMAEEALVASILSPILMGGRPAGCYVRYIRTETRPYEVFHGNAPWSETVALPTG